MKVLVTGGTGFVGQHSVRALLDAGHTVKLFARSAAKVPFKDVEVAEGDVTDAGAVAKAIAGCDAVLHCASVYSLAAKKNAEMLRVNVAGTRTVLEAGIAAGCNPVVHVSSPMALLGSTPRGQTLSADSPVGDPLGVYPRTKRDSELAAADRHSPGRRHYLPGQRLGPGGSPPRRVKLHRAADDARTRAAHNHRPHRDRPRRRRRGRARGAHEAAQGSRPLSGPWSCGAPLRPAAPGVRGGGRAAPKPAGAAARRDHGIADLRPGRRARHPMGEQPRRRLPHLARPPGGQR
jgi:hypothetical protein